MKMYYNPYTKEVINSERLSMKYNISIPKNAEKIKNFFLLHNETVEYDASYQRLIESDIIEKDGKFYRTFRVVGNIETVKQNKKKELKEIFTKQMSSLCIKSSLGFYVDADTIALMNIRNLIDSYVSEIEFRDAKNNFNTINLDALNTLKSEVIESQQNLYQKKWEYEKQISELNSVEELNKLRFKF